MQANDVAPLKVSALQHVGIGAGLLIGQLVLLPLALFVLRRLLPPREPSPMPWRARHVGIVAGWIIAGLLATSLLLSLSVTEPSTTLTLAGSVVVFGSASLLVVAIAFHSGAGWSALGVRGAGTLRSVLGSLCLYPLFLPGIFGIGHLWQAALEATGIGAEPQHIAEELSKLASGERFVPVVLGVLFQPLFEETLFRGFLQPLFVRRVGGLAGVALTSAVFAALHGLSVSVPIFALSFLLGVIMLRTQRLAACWTVHAVHNGLQFLVIFALPHLRDMAP